MPLIVSILQGWSHICEVGKSGFCETLLTQCNSCARRLVLSAKLFFLSSPILFIALFISSRFSSHSFCCVSFSQCAFSRKLLMSKAFSATCSEDVSNAILQWARVAYLKNFCGYTCSKQSKTIKEGLVKEERVLFRAQATRKCESIISQIVLMIARSN